MPVADFLLRRSVPFVDSSGYAAADLPDRPKGAACFEKPFRMAQLLSAVGRICRSGV